MAAHENRIASSGNPLAGADPEAVVQHVAVADSGAGPDDGEVVKLAALAELLRRRRRSSPIDARARADARARPDDGVLDDPASLEPGPRTEHGQASQPRALLDDCPRPHVDGRDEPGGGVHVGRRVDEREVRAERVAHLGREDPLEDVAMRLQIDSGVPTSSQYPGSAMPYTEPSAASLGNTSRSIETARPGGTSSSTSGSST